MEKPYWNVFRTPDQTDGQWQKVGVAFLNRDGSYNLRLKESLTPVDKLQMRPALRREKSKEQFKSEGLEAGVA